MRRTRVSVAVAAVVMLLLAFGLAGCSGSGGGSSIRLSLPDFSKVFVSDQDAVREYLDSKFTVVKPEGVVSPSAYYAYSSEACAEACPTMDRATATAAGDAFDMPGEWALYGITPTNAILRVFGVSDDVTNEELVTLIDNACGVRMAMAYSTTREGTTTVDRTLWALTDSGVWFSIDSTASHIVNFSVSSTDAGWMNETTLAQRIADLESNPDSSLKDIYTLNNSAQE